MTILLVEDEEKLVEILKKALGREHYTVDTALDGEAGLEKALKNTYDLIVLDLMLPKRDGLEVCEELRRRGVHTPIVILTARGLPTDRVSGLDLGADDYLTKPFEMDELLARIRAILRRRKTTDSLVLKVGDLVMDTKSHEVTRGGKRLALTPKEYRLLDTLMRHKGEVLSRQLLLSSAWGPDFKETNFQLNVHMKYLRNKVDKDLGKPLINTVRGVGYAIKE